MKGVIFTRDNNDYDWYQDYENLEDCYIPAKDIPPIKTEWRHRYTEYFWQVTLTRADIDTVTAYKSIRRPVITNGFLGIYESDKEKWTFIALKSVVTFSIIKYQVKVRYKLLGEQWNERNERYVYRVIYKEDEPQLMRDAGEEW